MKKKTPRSGNQRPKKNPPPPPPPPPYSKDEIFRHSSYPIPEKLKFSFVMCMRATDVMKAHSTNEK